MENTYRSFDDKTAEEVKKLIAEFGSDEEKRGDLSECQNESPSVGEFLEMEMEYPFIKYIGYIILKPRGDYRVSIEGFTIDNLLPSQALELYDKFDNADEKSYKMDDNGQLYSVRFWWD